MDLDRQTRVSVAVREARAFKKKLERDFLISQVFMVVMMGSLLYFGADLKWVIIYGFWSSVGTIGYLLKEIAVRLDAGRAYLEIFSDNVGESIDWIEGRLGESLKDRQ